MRARRKRHLSERMEKIGDILLVREYYGFYDLTEEQRHNVLDFENIFGNSNPMVLEIGCGKGKFANEFAACNPDKNILAVEKISNVIIDACVKTEELNISNLRYMNCSAENLLYFIKEGCVSEIYLNFSTPYPKKGNANRRLTHKRYLDIYKKLLCNGGKIYLKTDNVELFTYSLQSLEENGFTLEEVCYDLHKNGNPAGNIMTEYESKFVSSKIPIMKLTAALPQ